MIIIFGNDFLSYSLRNCIWSSSIGWWAHLSDPVMVPDLCLFFLYQLSAVALGCSPLFYPFLLYFSEAKPLLISSAVAKHDKSSVSSALKQFSSRLSLVAYTVPLWAHIPWSMGNSHFYWHLQNPMPAYFLFCIQ